MITRLITSKLGLILTAVSLVLGLTIWLNSVSLMGFVGSDLVQDYTAGLALRQGESIYGPAIERISTEHLGHSFQNFHPPFNAIFFLPLSFFPHHTAFVVWGVVSLVLYLGLIFLVTQEHGLGYRHALFFGALGLLWYPFIYGIGIGQSSNLLAFLITVSWLFLHRGRAASAGALLGLACLIKLFPALLACHLLNTRNWRALVSMAVVFISGLILVVATIGLNDCLTYVQDIMHRDVEEWGSFVLNTSLTGLLLPLLTVNPWVRPLLSLPHSTAALISFGASFLVVVAAAVQSARLSRSGALAEGFGLLCVAMILASPISWMHIFPVLMLPLFRSACRSGNSTKFRIVFLLSLLTLSLPDAPLARIILPLFEHADAPWFAHLFLKAPCLGLGFLWWLIVRSAELGPSCSELRTKLPTTLTTTRVPEPEPL